MTTREGFKDLFAAASSGDRQAFARIYGLAAPRLFGIALRMLRDGDEAAAVMKDVFVRLWSDAEMLSRQTDPLAAMVARVRAAALDLARGRAEDALALEPFESEEEIEDPLADAPRSTELKQLLTCLGHLSEERRRMVLHAYYDGWSREALSVYFDAPSHAVNTWIRRSIAELDACTGP